MRGITRHAITDHGIVWTDGKDKSKAKVLIEWSGELRPKVKEALAVKRNKDAGTILLFGNMTGQRYTMGGWQSILHDLMTQCGAAAAKRRIEFRKFSLQDCRPLGVSDKLDRGDQHTHDATGHRDGMMISQVYDRRKQEPAKPAA